MKSLLSPLSRKGISGFAAVTMASIVLAACGSSSSASSTTNSSAAKSTSTSSQSNALASATTELKKYESPESLSPPGPAFNASQASGKLVWVVEQLAANPSIALLAESVQTALTHEGVKVLTCDAHGISLNISSCMQQGLSLHASAMVIDGGDPRVYAAGTQAAIAAKVPVISAQDVPAPTASIASQVDPILKGLSADAGIADPLAGKLMADFIAKDSKLNAHVLFITSPGIVGAGLEEQSFDSRLKQLCPNCTVDSQGIEIPNWASDIGPTVSSQLRLHPNINYVVPVFDPMVPYTNPAILQAGKSASVKVVTSTGTLQAMQDLSKGQLVVCDVAQDFPEMGFIAADETLRYLTGQTGSSLVKDAQAGLRVFTSANIGSVKLVQSTFTSGALFTGSSTALSNMYYKLWSGS